MNIRGNPIPSSFARDLASDRFRRERGSWELKEERDYYGNALETELGEVYATPDALLEQTIKLADSFRPDGCYGLGAKVVRFPELPDVVDFTQVVCFAVSGDGGPFCFDYRDSGEIPRVIWWDDDHWRVVAPDYDSFVRLFRLPSKAWQ